MNKYTMRSCLLILHHRRMVNNIAVGTSTTRSARGLAVTETSAETDMSLDGEASLDHCRVVITKSGKRLVYDTCARQKKFCVNLFSFHNELKRLRLMISCENNETHFNSTDRQTSNIS